MGVASGPEKFLGIGNYVRAFIQQEQRAINLSVPSIEAYCTGLS